jgi:hypothetical protein
MGKKSGAKIENREIKKPEPNLGSGFRDMQSHLFNF